MSAAEPITIGTSPIEDTCFSVRAEFVEGSKSFDRLSSNGIAFFAFVREGQS